MNRSEGLVPDLSLVFYATGFIHEQLAILQMIDLVRLLCNDGPAVSNNRGHFVSGRVNHHVSAHQGLRLCAGTQISPEFRLEVKLFDPTVGSFLLDDVVHGSYLDPCSSNAFDASLQTTEFPLFRHQHLSNESVIFSQDRFPF